MKYKALMSIFLGMATLPSFLYAHGVMGKIDTGAIVVTAMYDTGEAMSYARVAISAPEARLTFQSGRTDRNGRFCFFPDTPGDWLVVVDDEMGHRLEVRVPVDDALALRLDPGKGSTGQGSSKVERIVMGISIIFGISGIVFWWKGRKDRAS